MILFNDILKVKGEVRSSFNLPLKKYNNVCINSLQVKKGDIFFAIKGEVNDGHKYIDEVIKRSAGLIFVNNKWYKTNKDKYKRNIFYVVKDTTIALGELAYNYKRRMNIPLLGVAGSNGKTSTKDIIHKVLSNKFNVIKTEGNYNNHIGLPLTLLNIKNKHNFCVAELGSNHFNELEYLCKIAEPDFGLVTNVGKEHMEFFKTLKGVAKEEFTLYDYVTQNGSTCFYNLDDTFINNYYKNHKIKSFTYSYKYVSNVKGINKGYNKNFNPIIEYQYNGGKHKTHINTFGKHSFYNGLSSIAVGLYFGVAPIQISKALKSLDGISQKRMETNDYSGVKVINDTYNSNPNSVTLGLETMYEYKINGKKHIIISDMLEMGDNSREEHYKLGKIIKKMKFDFVYTYGPMSYNIFEGAKGLKNNFYFENKEILSEFVKLNVKSGDVAYFKGSRGMKIEEVVENIFKK